MKKLTWSNEVSDNGVALSQPASILQKNNK